MDCPFALVSETYLKPLSQKKDDGAKGEEVEEDQSVSPIAPPNKNIVSPNLSQQCNKKEVTGLEEMIGSESEEQDMKEYTEYQEKEIIKSGSEVESTNLEIEDETYVNMLEKNKDNNKNAPYLWVVKQTIESPPESPPTSEPEQSPKELEKLLPKKPSMSSPPASSPSGGITTTRTPRVSDLCNSTSPRTYSKLLIIIYFFNVHHKIFQVYYNCTKFMKNLYAIYIIFFPKLNKDFS
jgi:hypothetical protein